MITRPKPARLRLLALSLFGLLQACSPPGGFVRSPELEGGSVTFRYWAPSARVVQVSGSWETNFNLQGRDWTRDTRVGRMRPGAESFWELRVPLGPGRYEYVFVVDGRIVELDPANPQRGRNLNGQPVSLLVVP